MILLYFSSDLHTGDDVVLPTGDGPSGQQSYLLDQRLSKSPEGPSGQQTYLLEQSVSKSPRGPSGQQTKLLDQSPMGPCEGHPISVPVISSPIRSVSRQILQSPTVVNTPERRLSREAQLRTPERKSASRKYLLYH